MAGPEQFEPVEAWSNALVSWPARAAIGLVAGLAVGLVITVVVIFAKVGFLVDSPRASHPLILIAFFVVPAVIGIWIGVVWGRRRQP